MSSNLRIACVTVGLPARGKTYIAQKVGEAQRHEAADQALQDMIRFFEKDGGIVAIYDATNSTLKRRKWILETLTKHGVDVLFIESICQEDDIIMRNIREVKLLSPDYVHVDPDVATQDFKARIEHYEEQYETICEEKENDISYIKLVNVGHQFIINMIRGYLESKVIQFLMNLHIVPRKIYLSRHGESMYNVEGKLGGDSELSPRGQMYASQLPDLVRKHLGDQKLTVWTSTLKRTIATARHLPYPKKTWKALDELDAGVCDGMTYEEIEEKYPEDFAYRDEDKFNYRYRGGESYRDVVLRLEPVVMELERQENILIVGHQAILRCLHAYFFHDKHEELPYIKIPLHTLIELTPRAYTCEEKRYPLKIDAVDTHRPKPKTTGSSLGHLSPGGLNTNVRNTKAGASGEIVISPMSPILPISPKLFPNIHSMTSDSQDRKPVSKQLTGSSRDDEHSVPGDMSALDLGAAATT
ncbi:Fructose-2 [Umbelopsis nana]